jgi:hypothetical protein
MAGDERRDERGHEALGHVEHDHRDRVPSAEAPPDVRRADVPAADPADVLAARPPDDPVPGRDAAGQIPEKDESESLYGYFSGIAYFDIQSFTVPQSRLSKNASM